ncbi:hypothetical protein PROVALCAL_01937 [Providencia alcalifaciens DSM 30120]|uniref:Uncharacterized protein n=1 Tax=Providencia alcalifaciens DSM 30120 TaxID=520999 RepID=B6XF06_9GAMM|nr:hypothetical protein PROVALCAL_01937 [Providencia alcalifaciens DSM 30120]
MLIDFGNLLYELINGCLGKAIFSGFFSETHCILKKIDREGREKQKKMEVESQIF